jgi:low affinity Fe/Cu permease
LTALLIIIWAGSGLIFRYSDTWQLVVYIATTIATLMVFLIQNSENRDAAAMQAKLDEQLRAVDSACGPFIGIEHFTDKQSQEIRAGLEKGCRDMPDRYEGKEGTVRGGVDRLPDRF